MGKNREKDQSSAESSAPTPEANDKEQRERLFKDSYDELVRKQISNSENFDRSVLTLSASGLGLSLAFLKDIVPLAQTHARWVLVVSWALFCIAIVATITSFMTSQAAIRFQINAAQKYYLERAEAYRSKTSIAGRITDWLNRLSGAAFIAAIICTIVFVVVNFPPAKP